MTLAAAISLGAVTTGLAGTAVGATPAVPTQHVAVDSTWVLTETPETGPPGCGTLTFGATTFTGSFGASGTWSGGRNWIALHFTSDLGPAYKDLGSYDVTTGGFDGHFAYPSNPINKPKSTLVPGNVCPL